jgi:hypothetical protein
MGHDFSRAGTKAADINRIFSSDEITAVAETPSEAWLEELPTHLTVLND